MNTKLKIGLELMALMDMNNVPDKTDGVMGELREYARTLVREGKNDLHNSTH